TRWAIVFQFLAEAMALTFLGGVIGLTLSIGISNLILMLVPALPAKVELWMIITSLTISVLIGLVFGVLPARKAAKLDPIEALRYE
ncbi:MAG TPA: FtsX-like permease family protein, partial [Pyrinomonadaceae bacterium]